MTDAWMIRAGRHGEREKDALTEDLAIAGWPELGDLSIYETRRDLRAAVRAVYPHRSKTVVANWTGQLWRLSSGIKIGDLVVMPLKTVPDHVAIGRVTGDYRYRAEAAADRRHVRPVTWIRREQPRSAIQQDLLYSLGSLLTICQLRRNGAARRIAVIAETGVDPGPEPDETQTNPLTTPDALLADIAAADGGQVMTTRQLIRAWGAHRRTATVVEAIQADLAEHALTTIPEFTSGGIDATIQVVRSGADVEDAVEETPAERVEIADSDASDGDSTALPEDELVSAKPFTLRFGNLIRSQAGVVSVRPSDSIDRARTLMLSHNYSQLASLIR